jgi:hypothetical protein
MISIHLLSLGVAALLTNDSVSVSGSISAQRHGFPIATADEAVAHLSYLRGQIENTISIKRGDYPFDSIRTVMAQHARVVLDELRDRQRSGLHRNAWGELFAIAQHDDSAQAQFNARLAEPGITVTEQAYTCGVAVRLFADYQRPARLPIAERYLTRLRTLGPRASALQLEGEYALFLAYYNLNRYDAASRHAIAAVDMLSRVPYRYRAGMYDPEQDRYGVILDALSRIPNGRAAIDTVNARMLASLPPSADSIALDQQFADAATQAKTNVELMITAHGRVGTVASPVTSNYWVNTPDTTEHALALNDGKIRLLEFGSTGCAPCVEMYAAFQRVYEAFPGRVEPIVVTGTNGSWANRLIEPVEESIRLKEWMLNDHKVRFPVVLYRRGRIATDYGDNPEGGDPNYTSAGYIFVGKPTTYLVDGTGTIRRVFVGYSRELERYMFDAVRHLLAEQSGAVSARATALGSPAAASPALSPPAQP